MTGSEIRLGALVDGGKPFLVPESIATQTIGILGQKGAGKSNTEVVLAEEFFAAGIPWVTVDPKGDWFGVRSSRDGQSPGLPIPVLGGLHGDVPLASTEGAQWADVIVDSNLTAVVDVSDFSKNESLWRLGLSEKTIAGMVGCSAWTIRRIASERDLPRRRSAMEAYKAGRWSVEHAACLVCGTTERKHVARGRCTQCYR